MPKYLTITNDETKKEAVIDIDGFIGVDWFTGEGNTGKGIKAELKEISNSKADTIIVNINSYGGDINEGLAIHDALAQHKAIKEVRINGMTASAATVIAMAGNNIEISDNALFLAHRASGVAIGNKNTMESMANDLKKVDERIINIYEKRTKKTKAEIEEIMDRRDGNGEWLTPEEAKTFGFVDGIFEPTKMAAVVDNAILNKLGLPSIPKEKLKPFTKNINMKSELRKKFDALYNTVAENLGFKNEVKEHKTEDGKVIKIDQSGDSPAVGDSVTDEAGAAVPDKSFTMADKSVIKTDADSKISEITAAPEEAKEEAKEENTEVVALKAELQTLKDENKVLKDSVTEVENEMVKLGKLITSKGKPATENETQFRTRTTQTGKEVDFEALKAKRKEALKKK